MTTTVQDIVRGALLLVGVLDAGESIEAAEAADGLTIFNDMIASWPAQSVHTGVGELALTDATPLEEYHTKGLKNLLAVELASQYGAAIPAKVAQDAQQAWQLIEADFKAIEHLTMDPALLIMPSQRRRF